MGSIAITLVIWASYIVSLFFLVYWLLFYIESRPRIKREYHEQIDLKRFPFVSVIVPAYNEERTIEKTLSSLIGLDWPKDKLEILVMDDGSKDKTGAIVKRFIRRHKNEPVFLHQQMNQGKAAAMNNALKILKGEYFACLDADSFIQPQALKHIIHWHEKDPHLAITTPVMKIATPKNWVQKFQRLEYMTGMLLTKLMSYMDANYVAPGPFSTYKTAIIRKLGGFDEDNLVEDQEIAYRAQHHHYRIRQVPHAIVETVGPDTLRKLDRQRNRWFKGTLLNIVKYKHMIGRKKYGDFGVFQMPLNISAFALGFITFFMFCYYIIKPLAQALHNYWLIRFDFLPYLQHIEWRFDPLAIQVAPTVILYLMLLLGVFFLYLSSRTNDDKVRAYGTFYIIPYLFVYFIMLSFVSVKVIFQVLIGKKQKW